jgi:hypothetical protein
MNTRMNDICKLFFPNLGDKGWGFLYISGGENIGLTLTETDSKETY